MNQPADGPLDPTAGPPGPPPVSPAGPGREAVIRPFVEHWGAMARSWGINATMGELFALLYLTGEDWDAEALRDRLGVSRGNVSMNLRELIGWGLVHKVNRLGERREYYRAEGNVWTLFRRILQERKRRELDPTLEVLKRSVEVEVEVEAGPDQQSMHRRLVEIESFFRLIDGVANRLLDLKDEEILDLQRFFTMLDGGGSASPFDA